jgi:hypothetical protein
MPHIQSELTGKGVPAFLQFHSVLRLTLLVHPLAVAAFAWLAPESTTGRMLLGHGSVITLLVLLAMVVLTLLGLLDALFNDWLPARWHFPKIKKNRHIGYMTLGSTMLMQVFAASHNMPPGGAVVIVYHLVAAFLCGLYVAAAVMRPSHAL